MIIIWDSLAELYCFRLTRPSVDLSVRLSVVTLTWQFSIDASKFHTWTKFEYGIRQMNDKQDGLQIYRRLSVALVDTLT